MGRYRSKGLNITIGYCGKRKDGDKFMYVWNNNGKILQNGIIPEQVRDLHEMVMRGVIK